MIYFAQSPDGLVTIGHAEDLARELARLRRNHGPATAILATFAGGDGELEAIHRQFAPFRIGRTDRYRDGPEMRDRLGSLSVVRAARPSLVHGKAYRFVQFRASSAFLDWLQDAARFGGASVADFLTRAASDRARAIGYDVAAPDRLG